MSKFDLKGATVIVTGGSRGIGPHVARALAEQGATLWHTSNLYRIGNGEKLAKRLADLTFADTMFFCNSGAEAIEGGIKLIRKYQYVNGQPQRYKLICFQAAFHGRLLNALAATGNEKYLEGFGPPNPGYKHAPLNNANVVNQSGAVFNFTGAATLEDFSGEQGFQNFGTLEDDAAGTSVGSSLTASSTACLALSRSDS